MIDFKREYFELKMFTIPLYDKIINDNITKVNNSLSKKHVCIVGNTRLNNNSIINRLINYRRLEIMFYIQ